MVVLSFTQTRCVWKMLCASPADRPACKRVSYTAYMLCIMLHSPLIPSHFHSGICAPLKREAMSCWLPPSRRAAAGAHQPKRADGHDGSAGRGPAAGGRAARHLRLVRICDCSTQMGSPGKKKIKQSLQQFHLLCHAFGCFMCPISLCRASTTCISANRKTCQYICTCLLAVTGVLPL